MNGREILRLVVDERLQELATVPQEQRGKVAGSMAAFCLGAADALMKSGLLPDDRHPAELDRLYEELERQGLGQRISAAAEASSTVVVKRPEDDAPST